MKNLRKTIERDLEKSIPTLGAGSPDIDGWCNRMVREYGTQLLSMMIGEAVRKNPSPSLESSIRSWANRQPQCGWRTNIIPFWAMKHLAWHVMKLERPGVRLSAESPSQSMVSPLLDNIHL